MKQLMEYFTQIDELDRQVLTHSNITLGYHEGDYFRCPQGFTFESLGVFPKCKDIVNYFVDHYEQHKNDDLWIIKSKDITNNLFFNELRISFEYDGGDIYGEYTLWRNENYDEKKWNESSSTFNFIDIAIFNPGDNIDDIAEILTHELQHVWDDYMVRVHGGSTVDKFDKHNFEPLIRKVISQLNLLKLSTDDPHTKYLYQKFLMDDIPILRKLLYYLDKFEGSAYIAQINGCLRGKMFDSLTQALDYIKMNCPTYDNYKTLYEIFNDSSYINKLEIIGFTKSAINKYKKIASQIWKKVVNHTYHIMTEHVRYNKMNENVKTFLTSEIKKIYRR